MFLQISALILLANSQGGIPLSAQLLQFHHLQNYTGSPTSRLEDNFSPRRTISLTSPLISFSTKQLDKKNEDISSPKEQPQHLVGEGSHQRRRREVPATSYGRSGSDGDGLKVALPGGEDHPAHADHPANESEPEEEDFNDDGSFTTTFQTENGIKSTTTGYQKILPSGEQGQAMHGEYSYTAPDGITVNTSWTADEKGFRVQGPHISVFGLGFGRRR